ncbi:MAG: serine protease [Anaerolineae bacterium]
MIWSSRHSFARAVAGAKYASPLHIAIVAILMLLSARPGAAQSFDLERIEQATVFIMQASASSDRLTISCVGSGTIVSRDGLILTNAHNTVPNRNCPGDTLIIAMNVRLDEPPVPAYQAEIAQADAGLDLALLRITRQSDGRLVDPATLALPYVELGDSDALELDTTITTVGYPDLGDSAVGVERGTVSGFTAEPSGGTKSWIKTSASIPGTMSGGGVYDQQGKLIGVPTTSPVIGLSPDARCVTLQDTNGDGAMNSSDICVPVGGFINSLRPSSFVRPLLRAASLDLRLATLTASGGQSTAAGTPKFSRLFFSPSVNEAQMPTSVVTSLPAGTDSVYLFFNYADMTPETVYELRVTSNGIPNPAFSLSPVRWSGGSDGVWYVGSTRQPWPNGLYDFTLFIDGNAADSKRLLIGQAAQSQPSFSDLVFGIQDLQGNVLGNGFVLPTGSVASARFIYRNMADGTPWTAVWYYQGSEVRRDELTWSDGNSGAKTISVQTPTACCRAATGWSCTFRIRAARDWRQRPISRSPERRKAHTRASLPTPISRPRPATPKAAQSAPITAASRRAWRRSTLCSTGSRSRRGHCGRCAGRWTTTCSTSRLSLERGGKRRQLPDPAHERGRRPRRHVQDGAVRRQGVVHVDRGASASVSYRLTASPRRRACRCAAKCWTAKPTSASLA